LFDIVEQELAMTDPGENLGLFGPAGPHPDPLVGRLPAGHDPTVELQASGRQPMPREDLPSEVIQRQVALGDAPCGLGSRRPGDGISDMEVM
jgi:hypothetical protein